MVYFQQQSLSLLSIKKGVGHEIMPLLGLKFPYLGAKNLISLQPLAEISSCLLTPSREQNYSLFKFQPLIDLSRISSNLVQRAPEWNTEFDTLEFLELLPSEIVQENESNEVVNKNNVTSQDFLSRQIHTFDAPASDRPVVNARIKTSTQTNKKRKKTKKATQSQSKTKATTKKTTAKKTVPNVVEQVPTIDSNPQLQNQLQAKIDFSLAQQEELQRVTAEVRGQEDKKQSYSDPEFSVEQSDVNKGDNGEKDNSQGKIADVIPANLDRNLEPDTTTSVQLAPTDEISNQELTVPDDTPSPGNVRTPGNVEQHLDAQPLVIRDQVQSSQLNHPLSSLESISPPASLAPTPRAENTPAQPVPQAVPALPNSGSEITPVPEIASGQLPELHHLEPTAPDSTPVAQKVVSPGNVTTPGTVEQRVDAQPLVVRDNHFTTPEDISVEISPEASQIIQPSSLEPTGRTDTLAPSTPPTPINSEQFSTLVPNAAPVEPTASAPPVTEVPLSQTIESGERSFSPEEKKPHFQPVRLENTQALQPPEQKISPALENNPVQVSPEASPIIQPSSLEPTGRTDTLAPSTPINSEQFSTLVPNAAPVEPTASAPPVTEVPLSQTIESGERSFSPEEKEPHFQPVRLENTQALQPQNERLGELPAVPVGQDDTSNQESTELDGARSAQEISSDKAEQSVDAKRLIVSDNLTSFQQQRHLSSPNPPVEQSLNLQPQAQLEAESLAKPAHPTSQAQSNNIIDPVKTQQSPTDIPSAVGDREFPTTHLAVPATSLEDTAPAQPDIPAETESVLPSQQVPPQGLAVGGQVLAATNLSRKPIALSDTVPAMLTPGEFVINATDAQKHLDLLQRINQGGSVENLPEIPTKVESSDTPVNPSLAPERSVQRKIHTSLPRVVKTLVSPTLQLAAEEQPSFPLNPLQPDSSETPNNAPHSPETHYTATELIFRKPNPTPSAPAASIPDHWSSVEDLLFSNNIEANNSYASTPTEVHSQNSATLTSTPEASGMTVNSFVQRREVAEGEEISADTSTPAQAVTHTIEMPAASATKANPNDLEMLAQEIYQRLRQRLELERERHGFYSGRLPW